MANISHPSVQALFISMLFNQQRIATGTAFVVQGQKGPLLITNRHNVTGRHPNTGEPLDKKHGATPNALEVVHKLQGQTPATWQGMREPLFKDDGTPRWLEHPKLGPKADFVALPLTSANGVEFFALDPANPGPNIAISPTSMVSVVGFPFGVLTDGIPLGIWATGFIASEPEFDAHRDFPTMLIDCRTRQGQSGSPVYAYREGGAVSMADGSTSIFNGPVFRFLGIYSGRINAESDLGIVWRASAIAELVASIT
jgi:hypothetical protein